MATGVSLTLPWPPSVNHYWRHPTKGKLAGRHLISEKGRAYREAVAEAVLLQARGIHMDGRLALTIIAQPPDRRRRDLDNVLKGVFDALQHSGLIADDGNIDLLAIVRANPIQGGRLVVHLSDADLARFQWFDLLTIGSGL